MLFSSKRRALTAAATVALLVAVAGCSASTTARDATTDAATDTTAPASTLLANPSASAPAAQSDSDQGDAGNQEGLRITITRVVDGDTVYTSDGKIRLIGYDTPEHGQCGFDEAKELVTALVLDQTVTLVNPRSVDDEDRYGRWLRYVKFDGGDLGVAVLKAGLAHARYDGQDGYDRHPLQDNYRALDKKMPHMCDG